VSNYAGVSASRALGVPLILEYNGSEAWVAKNWGRPLWEQDLAERVERVNLRHAHLVVTVSDVLRDELLDLGMARERIVSYPNCIDPEMFDPSRFTSAAIAELRRRHGIPADAVVVTFIGTFGQWHGAEVLADAIHRLMSESRPWVEAEKVHFLLVGDGLKLPEVRRILGTHAEGPRVHLVGLVPQREAALYLAAADILSSPHVPNADGSRFFGSPTKLFEYMAMAKGIVASDLDQIGQVLSPSLRVGALPRGIEDNGGEALGVLCRPGSAVEHAEGIRFLVDHAGWRRRLGANARRQALGRYTWRHHVQAILAGFAACH
jgi:glycosyltransferase involved in cell wall biosynthesis